MTTQRLRITELISHTVTRSTGGLAYENLGPYLDSGEPIEIDISGDYPLSLSFLDELARRLAGANKLDQVTFVVGAGGDALHKLSRIAEIRQVNISYADVNTMHRKTVSRLAAPSTEVSIAQDKRTDDFP